MTARGLHPLISSVVDAELATLYEVNHVYSIDDVADMGEILSARAENNYREHRELDRKQKSANSKKKK